MAGVEQYLAEIRRAVPSVDALLTRRASMILRDYVAGLSCRELPAFQDRQDFVDECVAWTRQALGASAADALGDDLARATGVLTANHHGIDTFAQSTQTNLLFAQRFGIDRRPAKTVPVLACGSIPLNNLTYPRGLLVYSTTGQAGRGEVLRLPIFPDSQKRTLVSAARPFSAAMLDRARARARRALDEQRIAPGLETALERLFDCLADCTAGFPDYSRQATAVNHRIWQMLFADGCDAPHLIYIELEKIVARLLHRDLRNPETICHRLLFDRRLRARLLRNLDGQRACWQSAPLAAHCRGDAAAAAAAGGGSLGTMFFWGVDARGRGFPLCVDEARGAAVLRGVDSGGRSWQCPLDPPGVERALDDGCLLPSVFTSYLTLAIARGIDCIGGYYQASYLPVMKRGVIAALDGSGIDSRPPELDGAAQPDPYLSGMQTIGVGARGEMRPAGPIEIIAGGGLDRDGLRKIGDLTLDQAHIGSLHDTLVDTLPAGVDLAHARRELGGLVYAAVGKDMLSIGTV